MMVDGGLLESGDPGLPELDKERAPSPASLASSSAETAERAYYHQGKFFIKRALRPSEYKTSLNGTKIVPRINKERLQNEAAAMRFIRQRTNIPVPNFVDECFMLIMEHVDGVPMSRLPEDQKSIVITEVEQHLATLRAIKSDTLGGLSGVVVPPYRAMAISERDDWPRQVVKHRDYVFCHNDLSQHNVVVDPDTLKIRAILDWEYAGFFPEYFEGPFYKRPGPSIAFNGERDDAAELLQFLNSLQVSTDRE